MSMQPRRGGPSLTGVATCALIHGPNWASSSSIWIPVQGQHHHSRGSKTHSYHAQGASSMLPHVFHKSPSFPPCPSMCHHVTPLCARTSREWAPRPNSATDMRPECWKLPDLRVEDLEKSGEYQHRTTHLSSLAAWETSIAFGLHARSRKPTQG